MFLKLDMKEGNGNLVYVFDTSLFTLGPVVFKVILGGHVPLVIGKFYFDRKGENCHFLRKTLNGIQEDENSREE
jgi:hypothetical protein